MADETKSINVTVPNAVFEALKEEAQREDRYLGQQVSRILKNYVDTTKPATQAALDDDVMP